MNRDFQSVKILSFPIFSGSQREARVYIAKQIQTKKGIQIFTPNPEILWQAHTNKEIGKLLLEGNLLLPDGVGVKLAAKLKGTPITERITGIDTGEWLLHYAAKHSLSVFLLGGKAGVAAVAKERLCKAIPALNICGTHHGYFDKKTDSQENQAVLQIIQKAKPDLLFVCFGCPAQEKWISENAPSLPFLRLSIGLGGALDVWSGKLRRAPKAVQACGAEWLWRTIREPKRIKRLLCLPRFLWVSARK